MQKDKLYGRDWIEIDDNEENERYCFYCNSCIAKGRETGEKDHFPIPKEAGGTTMVWACGACHDMKDRFPLEKWPSEWWYAVIGEFPAYNRETRIFLAKAMAIVHRELANLTRQGTCAKINWDE
jgi:hypothetical protein